MSSWETPRRDLAPHAIPPSQRPAALSQDVTNRSLSFTPDAGFMSPNRAPTAGYSSNPSSRPKPPLRPFHLLGFTPFGAFCLRCKIPVCSSKGQLKRHLTKHPEVTYGDYGVDNFISFAIREVEKLKLRDPSEYLIGCAFSGFSCKRCGMCFIRRDNGVRHTRGKKNTVCSVSDLVIEDISQTICGRLAPATASAPALPKGADIPYLTTADWLEQYVPGDEKVSVYNAIYHPVTLLGDNADTTISLFVDSWCNPPEESEGQLADLLQLAKTWLFERARLDTALVPANYRAAIQVFEGQEVGEVAINFTYNFRHFETNLSPELAYMLCFAWRRSTALARFKNNYDWLRRNRFFVPQILHALFVEESPNYLVQPTIVLYVLSRSFRKTGEGLKMIKCDLTASQTAASVSLLRASTCGVLVSIPNDADLYAPGIVKQVRSCRNINVLCTHTRHMKEMNARKGTSRMKTVSDDGTVAVENYEFTRDVWSKLIPSIFQTCQSLLEKLIIGDDWIKVLDSSTPVSVQVLNHKQLWFRINFTNGMTFTSDQVAPIISPDSLDYDRLVSYLSLAFFGCGGGATRGSEIMEGLMLSQSKWHRNTAYYDTYSKKVYASRAHTNAMAVEHKLPSSIGRLFLLLRAVTNKRDDLDLKLLLPRREGAKHSMTEAVAELFNFATIPSSTQVRQFFTGVSNVLFGLNPNWDGVLSATGDIAEMAGHSATTHSRSYSSSLVGGRETVYRVFHQALGSDIGICSSSQSTRLELLNGMRSLFGPDAYFTSDKQRQMVFLVANETTRHAHIGLPCGSGKSAAWLAPVVSDYLTGKAIKTIVVVLPYKFLVDFHLKSANDKVSDFDISVLGFTGKEIRQSTDLPVGLRTSSALPNLLFLSLEGMVNLLKFHATTLKGWVQENAVRRFIIDEVHTMLGESFRSAYEWLPSLATYGVPIATMSGTVPGPVVPHLLRYLGLTVCEKQNDIDLLEAEDCVGSFPPSFRFLVKEDPRPLNLVSTAVKSIARDQPQHGVHVMVSGKPIGEKLYDAWRNDMSCEFVSSDTPEEDQTRIAKAWSEGAFKVLISTTIALVGNENSKCRHVVIVGYLYSMINVVQAMGRLRPNQREEGASIQIYLQSTTDKRLADWELQETRAFESLRDRKLIGDDRDMFTKVATNRGLYNWLTQDVGCRIKNLGARYGFVRDDCGFCDVCRGTPTRTLATRATTAVAKDVSTMNRALLVLKKMSEQCLQCNSKDCGGEKCMGRTCFRCGGQHFSKACGEKQTASLVLDGKACYDCYDFYERRDFENHDKENCPLQRRLRRMVHVKFQTAKVPFGSFLTSIYSEAASFYSFVDSLSPSK
jgi:superfamily II DNA helicase RecQ